MTEDRRATLLSLVQLAESGDASSCFDDRRAVELLRSRTSPAELRALGVSEEMIGHIFEGEE